MKKTVFAAGFLFLAFSAQEAGAEYKKHTFELSPEISSYEYEEPSLGVKLDGTLLGVTGTYAYHEDDLMLGASLSLSGGEVDYTGTGTTTNNDYILELRGLVGRDFSFAKNSLGTIYGGLGYRHLADYPQYTRTSTGALTYDRVSRYFYVPLGVDAISPLDSQWGLRGNLEYDLFLKGRQTSYLSQASSYYIDVDNDQTSGYGLRGALSLVRNFPKNELEFGFFFRYWDIGNSDLEICSVNGAVICREPANTTTEVGLRAAVKWDL